MPTTFGSFKTTGTLVVAGTLTAVAIAMSGVLTLGGQNITGVGTMSGATLQVDNDATVEGTMSGAKLTATPVVGSGGLTIYGDAKGSHLCLRDTDDAGWTAIDALNGTVTAHTASAGECP